MTLPSPPVTMTGATARELRELLHPNGVVLVPRSNDETTDRAQNTDELMTPSRVGIHPSISSGA